LQQAVSYLETTGYQHLWVFGPIGLSKAFPRKAIDETGQHAQQVFQALGAARNEQAREIESLNAALQELRKELAAVRKRVDAEQTRVGAVADEGRASFAKSLSDFAAKSEQDLKERGKVFAVFTDESERSLEHLKNDAHSKTNALVQKMEERAAQAKRLVGLVGDTAVTGNYQTTATKEASEANLWRWITLGVFVAAGAVGVWALIDLANKTVSWEFALVRIAFGLLVGTVAFYTGNESARHRTNSDRAKRIELELASLGPFLEELPQEKREEVRQNLSEKYFANETSAHSAEGVVSSKDVMAIAEKSIDALKKFRDK
jgi:hypothetical protein